MYSLKYNYVIFVIDYFISEMQWVGKVPTSQTHHFEIGTQILTVH